MFCNVASALKQMCEFKTLSLASTFILLVILFVGNIFTGTLILQLMFWLFVKYFNFIGGGEKKLLLRFYYSHLNHLICSKCLIQCENIENWREFFTNGTFPAWMSMQNSLHCMIKSRTNVPYKKTKKKVFFFVLRNETNNLDRNVFLDRHFGWQIFNHSANYYPDKMCNLLE